MSKSPEISIILPTYNGEKFICEAIESVIKQEFDDWELIIVDDCSTDNTRKIINKYASNYERISVVRNEINQKLPKSLNIGFSYAKGEYLTWTSDDNIFFPQALHRMYQWLEKHLDIPLVCADYKLMNEDGVVLAQKPPHFNEHTILLEPNIGACFLYRREVLQKVGEYNPNLFCVEDHDYWQRIWKAYGQIGYIDDVLYCYRFQSNSLSVTHKPRVIKQRALLHRKNFFELLQLYHNEKVYLCHLYYDLLSAGKQFDAEREQIMTTVPELKKEILTREYNMKYMIFGAGTLGNEAADILGDSVACFIDNDSNKWGSTKRGKKVLSLSCAVGKYKENKIIIAVSVTHIYEIIRQLMDVGIREYSTLYGMYYLEYSN